MEVIVSELGMTERRKHKDFDQPQNVTSIFEEPERLGLVELGWNRWRDQKSTVPFVDGKQLWGSESGQ